MTDDRALVTRLLSRRKDADIYFSNEADVARQKEADKLISKPCIATEALPREWEDVVADDPEATVAPGAMLISQKGVELAEGQQEIKGRFIIRGDLQENADGEIAPDSVDDQVCLPLQIDQLRTVLAAGVRKCKRGAHRFAIATGDEENGYINKLLRSEHTWLDLKSSSDLLEGLPAEIRETWAEAIKTMRRPVAPMRAAMYGLKRVIFDYEHGRNAQLVDRGAEQVGPSIFTYRTVAGEEAVIGWFVDDWIAVGDIDAVEEFTEKIQQPGKHTPALTLKPGWSVMRVSEEAQSFRHIGINISFALEEDAIRFSFDMVDYARMLTERVDSSLLSAQVMTAGATPSATSGANTGRFAHSCRSLVSGAQHLARICLPECVQPLNSLSTRFTNWGTDEDRRLLHTFAYIKKCVDENKVSIRGVVGTHDELHEDLFTDSDHAGCPFTRRSTSGAMTILTGNVTHWPIAWSSNLQKFVTRCSGEAEGRAIQDGLGDEVAEMNDQAQNLHALSTALARGALGQVALFERLIGDSVHMRIFVDATTALACARRGSSKLMQYLPKTQSVDFLWIKEVVEHNGIEMLKVESSRNPADILTKTVSSAVLREIPALIGRAAIA